MIGGTSRTKKLTIVYGLIVAAIVIAYWHQSWNIDISISSIALTGGYILDIQPKTQPVTQPVDFPHQHHVQDVGLNCDFCHSTVKTQDFATIPNIDTCKTCHIVQQTNGSPREQNLRQNYVLKNKTIPWKRIYTVPSHVYFSHKRHVVTGNIDCTTCHGPVPQQNHALTKPLNELTMEFCIDCHVDKKQTNTSYRNAQHRPPENCLRCHR